MITRTTKTWLFVALLILMSAGASAQGERSRPPAPPVAADSTPVRAQSDAGDLEQMRAEVERLKVLLHQMRNNLAFVQSSQTPLKHQFELEADAWQVVVEQMDRHLKRMEDAAGRTQLRR
ncbi:MAG TPA: hypothetical protein VLT90_02315 [Terriglobales bacterium]|nr:hypothetical protein [Terriglobales bacterium]